MECPADGFPAQPWQEQAMCKPDSGLFAYSFARTGSIPPVIIVSRLDGTCARRVTPSTTFSTGASFLVGGRQLAYASTKSGTNSLYLLDLVTGAESKLDLTFTTPTSPPETLTLAAATPAVSPDGLTIAFEGSLAAYPGWSDIFTAPIAGGAATEVGREPVAASQPAWSNDGSTIYFTSRRGSGSDIYSVPAADGVAATRVTTDSRISSAFTLSGDGKELVYARFSTTGTGVKPTELVAQDIATSAIRVISSNNEADPAVDATNSTVAVSRRSATGYDLYLLDYATGATIRQLTNCPGQAFGATFSR
jgi:TolB protein